MIIELCHVSQISILSVASKIHLPQIMTPFDLH